VTSSLVQFADTYAIDFEFHQPPGENPKPLCVAFHLLGSERTEKLWLEGDQPPVACPFPVDGDTLIVAYFASAEMNCFVALGWPFPKNLIDLYAEFRVLTNGLETGLGNGLLAACATLGLGVGSAEEKGEMRELAIGGRPLTSDEQIALMDYNASDATATAELFEAMRAKLDLPRALLRGRYVQTVAKIESSGIPVDLHLVTQIVSNRDKIKGELIRAASAEFGVYENGQFKRRHFMDYCAANSINWPRTASGDPDLRDETFKAMAMKFPAIERLRQTRKALTHLSAFKLPVGTDGRNRTLLSPFASVTGRNQPSSNKSVFGLGAWARGLIKPSADRALAYLDYRQQEIGIAAALSADTAMLNAYHSGDFYVAFATMAGAMKRDLPEADRERIRGLYKQCALGVQYGMGVETLAERLDISRAEATSLIATHKSLFPTYWEWSQRVQDTARMGLPLHTPFGWPMRASARKTTASIRNFPVQASAADVLRIACVGLDERGITICAPVHDALLIESSADEIDASVAMAEETMERAGEAVVGARLHVSANVVRHPERFADPRGAQVWSSMTQLLG
jgi:DNA polymerase-1